MKSSEFIKEDATGGATGSSSVAVVMGELGGGMSKEALKKKQQSYTNQQTAGGPVKVKKSK